MLVHVIDASKPAGRAVAARSTPSSRAYGAGLDERPQIVVLNKIDLEPEPGVRDRRPARSSPCSGVSCATGAGDRRASAARSSRSCPSRRPRSAPTTSSPTSSSTGREPKARRWRLLRTEGGFRVARHAAVARRSSSARCARPARATGDGRGRRRGVRARADDRALRRRVRPAAPRPRRSSRGARRTRSASTRLVVLVAARSGAQARRDAGGGPPRAGAGGVPGRRGRARRPRAHGRHAARPPGVGRSGLPDRRRRVLRLPDVEGARRGAAPRAARASPPGPGFPRERLERGARGSSTQPERVLFFEIEPIAGRLAASCGRGSIEATTCRPRSRTLIRREGLYGRDTGTLRRLDAHSNRHAGSRRSPRRSSARDVVILDMQPVCAYTDYFVVAPAATRARRRGSGTRCTPG